jgi:kynureninase
MSHFENTLAHAKQLDAQDPLKSFRDKFYFPNFHENTVRYFTGNSLGLQPKSTREYIIEELDAWAKYGVEGHFLAKKPWFAYH